MAKKVILLIEFSSECGRRFLRGITKYSALHGPWVFYIETPWGKELSNRKRKSPWFREVDADGIVVRDIEKIEEVVTMQLPIIVGSTVKQSYPELPSISADSKKIGIMGAEHFIERGFREFAFLGYNDVSWSQSRCIAFQQRLAQNGFKAHICLRPNIISRRGGKNEQNLITDWLNSLPKPIGIMTCTDYRAQQLIESCKTAGIHVPEEIAILGVDNDDLVCNLCSPPLSSIDINHEHAGYEAAELLDRLMAGEKMEGQEIVANPTQIVTRQSTNIYALEDIEVANALRFIREHCMEPIQVSDVVNATSLSQRRLYERFTKAINRSIHAEITHVRCEKISRLLLETHLTVSQIAIKMSYYDDRHLSRYFKNEMGVTPREFRRLHGHSSSSSQEST